MEQPTTTAERPDVDAMVAHEAGHTRAHAPSRADPWFWQGFGLDGCPSFDGRSVMEVGCGTGARCFEAARHGARRVLGIDPFPTVMDVAQARLAEQPADVRARMEFRLTTIEGVRDERFDVILSENTFEHVMNVPEVLAQMRDRLTPGGRAYIGFGPPYHAPEGDHGWMRAVLPGRNVFPWPWGHLLFPKGYIYGKLSKAHGHDIKGTTRWPYLDLNQHTVADYKRMYRASGLRIASIRTNLVYSVKGRIIRLLGRVPGLSKYCTLNMFCVLERPA